MQSFLASRSRAMPRGFGRPLKRREDPRLLTGAGRFSDDVSLPGQAHACFVRLTRTPASAASTRRPPSRCRACWRC